MTQGNIYFDFNATTPIDPFVQEHLGEWASFWGNPSSIHAHGRGPKKLLRESRRGIAQTLNCHPLELVFTSGGSEANNLAIKGSALEIRNRNPLKTKIILGAIEHPSVLKQAESLKSLGFQVEFVPVDQNGNYDLVKYESFLDENTALVSVMFANNELGVLSPIHQMVELAHRHGAVFHSDMVQALGKTPFDLKQLNVDLASFSSHKVYALKGSGLLYIKKGTPFQAMVDGGAQERGRRAGTENLLSIVSFAKMIERQNAEAFVQKIEPLRNQLEAFLKEKIEGIHVLCEGSSRLANTSCFWIEGVSGESLLMNLDIRGFSVGTGAACSSGNPEPSPVLLAIGLTRDQAQSSLRVSLGKTTSEDEVKRLGASLVEVVQHLRSLESREVEYVETSKGRVLVAMSGGVDSSVAAALLVEQGYEVIGVTMQVWDYTQCNIEEGTGTCCSSEDVDDARDVADRLNIPFYVLNCEDEFKEKVIDPFVNSYMEGKTPLPCVNCNTYLKFDHLIKKMKELSCDYLATGHYATLTKNDSGQWGIVTSADSWKDQTYFLFTIQQELIPKLIFPVGEMNKAAVRKYAEEKDLIVARKKDSVGICFVDKSGYGDFIDTHYSQFEPKKGLMKRYPSGEVLREHNGIHHFTYGQRKGLGISAECPLYVLKVDPETHEVWVGTEDHLFSSEMIIDNCHWLDELKSEDYFVKIRYSHKGAKAAVERLEDGRFKVRFYEKQRAITPGQAAVFYQENRLIGGGWIL